MTERWWYEAGIGGEMKEQPSARGEGRHPPGSGGSDYRNGFRDGVAWALANLTPDEVAIARDEPTPLKDS